MRKINAFKPFMIELYPPFHAVNMYYDPHIMIAIL